MYCRLLVRPTYRRWLPETTHHPKRPEHEVEHNQPSLLTEPREVFPLVSGTSHLRKRCENVFHDTGAKSGQQHHPKCNKVPVVEADTVSARFRV